MTANISYDGLGFITSLSLIYSLLLVVFAKDVDFLPAARENDIIIPQRFRSEGLVVLELERDDDSHQHEQHHLPFIEYVDSVKFQATVTIGHVSYAPNTYYKKLGSPMVQVLDDEYCGNVENSSSPLVPEISWFANILLPVEKVPQLSVFKQNIGPTGLLLSLLNLQKTIGNKFEGSNEVKIEESIAEHRYIKCHVSSRKFRLDSKGIDFKLEIYTPSPTEIDLGSSDGRLFSIKATASFAKNNSYQLISATFTLDYLNFHQIDLNLDESMEKVFQLPLGRGCSKYLKQIQPSFDVLRSSFSFEYKQLSQLKSMKLSYDHSSALLQKAPLNSGEEVSIWDLNRSLLINIGYDREDKYVANSQSNPPNWDSCAILKVDDKQLSPILRPNQDGALKLDFLNFVGATSLAYMGHGSIRDLPCLIYESIVPEAPAIFWLTESKPNQVRDYIVQFHLLRGTSDHETFSEYHLSSIDFKPLRLTLIRRFKVIDREDEIAEELEVYDFSWSLDTRGSELFRVRECFTMHALASEQVELEMGLVFERVGGQNASVSAEKWFEQLWPLNKPKFELEMLSDLFRLLKTNRLHMVEYDLKPRGKHLDVNINLADWAYKPRRVSLVAEGTLTSEFISHIHRWDTVRYNPSSEHLCLAKGSLIRSASLVIYCNDDIAEGSICIASKEQEEEEQESLLIKGFHSPETGNLTKSDSSSHCRAYRFEKLEPGGDQDQLGGVGNVIENMNLLNNFTFRFVARLPTGTHESWLPRVDNFELKHSIKLETIDNYAFQMDWVKHGWDSNLHTFDSLPYKNLEVCTRMCDLDISCRSYSFCLSDDPRRGTNTCVISALDIRASKIAEQLESKQPDAENITTVSAHGISMRYNLIRSRRCKIYERNYMDIFRQTEEVIRLKVNSNATKFPKTDTTFACAKLSAISSQQVAMFAYCATSNLCILDENLFSTESDTNNNHPNLASASKQAGDEIACRVYRKKYQSFFAVSGHVIEKSSLEDGQQLQIDQANSVEACARFCWDKFDGKCNSFDFCEPGLCLINQVGRFGSNRMELKTGCLHYGRDFARQANEVQQMLETSMDMGGGLFPSLLTCLLVMASILLGMRLGNRLRANISLSQLFSSLLAGINTHDQMTSNNNQPAIELGSW